MTRTSVRDRNDPRYRTRTLSRIVIVILSHHLVWHCVFVSLVGQESMECDVVVP